MSLNVNEWRSLFDPNVVEAFRAAMQFKNFLKNQVAHWSGNHPENVNILAHSLGNLVMYEALRLAELEAPANTKFANNLISVEAAVWKEAFESESNLTYPDATQGYSGDAVTYSVDEQKKTSWRFWYRQKDGGVEHNLKRLLTGQIYDSYNPTDYAVAGAGRINDYLMRNIPQETHYNRHGTIPTAHWNYRTVNASGINDAALQNIPALMSNRTLIYGPVLDGNLRHTLFDGVGQVNLMLGSVNPDSDLGFGQGANKFFDVPINARDDDGWPQYSHGAAFYDGDTDRDGNAYDTSMPTMAAWYTDVFNTKGAIKMGN